VLFYRFTLFQIALLHFIQLLSSADGTELLKGFKILHEAKQQHEQLSRWPFGCLSAVSHSLPSASIVITASIISCGLLIFVLLLMIWGNKFKWCGVALHQGSSGGIIAFRYTDLGHATKKFTQRLGGGELNWIHTAHQPSQTYWILL
jgi:hypothetical protein